ncbi:hypothetical protein CYMTET_33976 [Cymbomonas tetramitiformis]|uniref:EF-hand domain-containing protein n=1 Tax=Cymbomonas tetramitiformis TaxID=36881 RepID=A0AAE0FC56_9CHLO|nr:hypothetical protein CYMTET_33976 [Cymbomonas tetramitiformis]
MIFRLRECYEAVMSFDLKGGCDVMSQLGSSLEDYSEFYQEIDADNSGTISKQEFKDWWVGRGQYKNVAKSFLVEKKQ